MAGAKTDKGIVEEIFRPGTKYPDQMRTYRSVFQAEIHTIGRCARLNQTAVSSNEKANLLVKKATTFKNTRQG